jgi:very-short-patch-repair endonuclease
MAGDRQDEADQLVRAHGGVITARQVAAAGWGRSWLRSAVAAGELVRLRQAVYTSGTAWRLADPARREALRLMAYQRIDDRLVGVGLSAAAAMGLPVPGPGLIRPGDGLVTAGLGLGRPRLRIARPEEEVARLAHGPVVTLPIVTVMDCARELPLEWGLALADAAITHSWVKPSELSLAAADLSVQGLTGPRGVRRARWVLGHARAGAESVLESLARAVVVLAGFPEPQPQRWITTSIGSFRVDLLDEQNRVIIEADGKLKYASADVLWHEKRREDALRDQGFEVARFIMANYLRPIPWRTGYERAVGRR